MTRILICAHNTLLRNRISVALLPPQPRDFLRVLDALLLERHALDLVDLARGLHLGKFVGEENGIWMAGYVSG